MPGVSADERVFGDPAHVNNGTSACRAERNDAYAGKPIGQDRAMASENLYTDLQGLPAALHATGPADGLAAELDMFGRFVGSWKVDWYGSAAAEEPDAVGELHFGWVLGGRAVQDVWIVPGPDQPGAGAPPRAFHGSTLRFYDPTLQAWRSTWIEPVNGRVRRFIGRPTDHDIELISLDGDPLLRWRFTEINSESFWWIGEYSTDETRTWHIEERMRCTRTA